MKNLHEVEKYENNALAERVITRMIEVYNANYDFKNVLYQMALEIKCQQVQYC